MMYFMNYFKKQDYYNEVYLRSNGKKIDRLMIPFGFIKDENSNLLIKKRGENNELQRSRKTNIF